MSNNAWIELYTDGSYSALNDVGGWAFLLRYKGHELLRCGRIRHSSSNRMEILAIIEGLNAIRVPSHVTVYTDSQYVSRTVSGEYKRRANRDLWLALDNAIAKHVSVLVNWVPSHQGEYTNDDVDKLANYGRMYGSKEVRRVTKQKERRL